MIPAPGDGSQQTPPPLAVTADPTPLTQTPAAHPLPLIPSMFVAATDGGVFSNWFIPLWMLPPIPGDGKLDANALRQILFRTTELAQTQMESSSQSPVPGQLPISQLIIPTVAMLNDPMMAQWTAPATPPGLPLYTEPRLIPPGKDACIHTRKRTVTESRSAKPSNPCWTSAARARSFCSGKSPSRRLPKRSCMP